MHASPLRVLGRFVAPVAAASLLAALVVTAAPGLPADARIDHDRGGTIVDPLTTAPERDPSIVHDSDRDDYLVVNERTALGGLQQVVASRFAPDGTVLRRPTVVRSDELSTVRDWRADAAYNPTTQQYLVVYLTRGIDHDARVVGRLLTADGIPAGDEMVVNASLGNGRRCRALSPRVEFDPMTGGYVLAYVHYDAVSTVGSDCAGLTPGHSNPVLVSLGADLSIGPSRTVPLERSTTADVELTRNPVTGEFGLIGVRPDDETAVLFRFDASLDPVGDVDLPTPAGEIAADPEPRLAADPDTGEWLVKVGLFTYLLGSDGVSTRAAVLLDNGVIASTIAPAGGRTWAITTRQGALLHVAADGSVLFEVAEFATRANGDPAVVTNPDPSAAGGFSGVAVGVDPTASRMAVLPVAFTPPAIRSVFPARLTDTREPPAGETVDGREVGGGPVAAGTTLTVQIAGRGGVPAGAVGAVVNIAAAGASQRGFVTGHPCDADRPSTSNLNFDAGAAASAAGFVRLSAEGTACFFVSTTTQLIVDVTGYVRDRGSVEALVPARLLETRENTPDGTVDGQFDGIGRVSASSTTELVVAGRGGVADDAEAVLVNVAAVNPSGQLFVTVSPCGVPTPNAASLNASAGSVVNNLVLAQVGDGGAICIFASAGTDLTVDVAAFVPAGGGLRAGPPARLLDTRPLAETVDGDGAPGVPLRAGQVTTIVVAGRGGASPDATGAFVNIAAIRPGFTAFITAFPCLEQPPNTANLNAAAGSVVSNGAFVRLDAAGRLCLRASQDVDVTVDLVGVTVDT